MFLERSGKAVRSPSKSVLLADAARTVGRGRGFAVHKALDQVGAFAGPLVVAGVLALTGATWPGFAVLAVPGVVAMVLLLRLRVALTAPGPRPPVDEVPDGPLPRSFHLLTVSCALSTFGLLTFGVLSFHLVADELLDVAWAPVVYAAAMGVEAVSALATGFIFDRVGGRTLLVLPALVALVPFLAFSSSFAMAVAGILVWGLATGILDSTVKALVAEVPRPVSARRTARSRPSRGSPRSPAAPSPGGSTATAGSRSCSSSWWPRSWPWPSCWASSPLTGATRTCP